MGAGGRQRGAGLESGCGLSLRGGPGLQAGCGLSVRGWRVGGGQGVSWAGRESWAGIGQVRGGMGRHRPMRGRAEALSRHRSMRGRAELAHPVVADS